MRRDEERRGETRVSGGGSRLRGRTLLLRLPRFAYLSSIRPLFECLLCPRVGRHPFYYLDIAVVVRIGRRSIRLSATFLPARIYIYIYIKAMFGEKRAKAFFRAVDKKGGGRAEDEATRGGRKRTAAMMGGRLRFLSNRRPFREVSSSSRNEKASSLPAISLESRLSD